MNTNALEYAESPRLALWTSLALGLGIVFHRFFFLVALGIALSAAIRWLIDRVHAAEGHMKPRQRRA